MVMNVVVKSQGAIKDQEHDYAKDAIQGWKTPEDAMQFVACCYKEK